MNMAEKQMMMGRLLTVIKGYQFWYKGVLKFHVLLMMIIGLERIFFIPSAPDIGMHGDYR